MDFIIVISSKIHVDPAIEKRGLEDNFLLKKCYIKPYKPFYIAYNP